MTSLTGAPTYVISVKCGVQSADAEHKSMRKPVPGQERQRIVASR